MISVRLHSCLILSSVANSWELFDESIYSETLRRCLLNRSARFVSSAEETGLQIDGYGKTIALPIHLFRFGLLLPLSVVIGNPEAVLQSLM